MSTIIEDTDLIGEKIKTMTMEELEKLEKHMREVENPNNPFLVLPFIILEEKISDRKTEILWEQECFDEKLKKIKKLKELEKYNNELTHKRLVGVPIGNIRWINNYISKAISKREEEIIKENDCDDLTKVKTLMGLKTYKKNLQKKLDFDCDSLPYISDIISKRKEEIIQSSSFQYILHKTCVLKPETWVLLGIFGLIGFAVYWFYEFWIFRLLKEKPLIMIYLSCADIIGLAIAAFFSMAPCIEDGMNKDLYILCKRCFFILLSGLIGSIVIAVVPHWLALSFLGNTLFIYCLAINIIGIIILTLAIIFTIFMILFLIFIA